MRKQFPPWYKSRVKDWLTTAEVGAALGVSRRRVARLIQVGRLESTRAGAIHLISPEEVSRFVREQAAEVGTKPGPAPNVLKRQNGGEGA